MWLTWLLWPGVAHAQEAPPLFVPTQVQAPTASSKTLREHVLANAESISGVLLPAGSRAWFTDAAPGVLLRAEPSADVTLWGVTFAAGTELRLDLGSAESPQRSGILA